MRNGIKHRSISNIWIKKNNLRFDSGPYLSGSIEAREIIENMRTEKLNCLTYGHNGGIYNGSPFIRNYVSDENYGVPFLTTSTINEIDLKKLPLLSKSDAYSKSLRFLEINEGMILVTCSGVIGKMAYSRIDMKGIWSNQDILKIVADPKKIQPGFLYAYLSSKFGIPMIISGTYGAIIQHIEPHHIHDLLVPRLGSVENVSHNLINRAAKLRIEAIDELHKSSCRYLYAANIIKDITFEVWHENLKRFGFPSIAKKMSFLAINYLPINLELENLIRKKAPAWKRLVDLTEPNTLRSGPRFKRIDADKEFGVELVGQSECFSLRPQGRWISRSHLPNDPLLFPPDGTTMIAAQGCAGEHDLFGRAQFITGKRLAAAYSQHFLRVIAKEDEIPRGALFAYLNTQIAYRIRKGYQIGSMQQDFHPEMIKNMPVPIIDRKEAEAIDAAVRAAYKKFDDALDAEDQARSLVERAIEEGGC